MAKIFADTQSKLDKAILTLQKEKSLGFDTEGSGLDPHTIKVWSIQIGTPALQVLIPLNGQPRRFKLQGLMDIFLDERVRKIAHNAAYDIKVLWSLGLDIENTWCTRVGEAILNAGTFLRNDLATTLLRHFNVKLSKDERKEFYCDVDGKSCQENGTLSLFELSGHKWTPELKDYALDDIAYLVPLYEKQRAKLEEEGMLNMFERIELPLVKTSAAIEYRGVKMNKKACEAFHLDMVKKADSAKQTLIYGDKKAIEESEEYKGLNLYWKIYAQNVYDRNHQIFKEWADRNAELIRSTNKMRDETNRKKVSAEAMAQREEWRKYKPFPSAPKVPKDINLNSSAQLQHAFAQAGLYLKNTQKATLQDLAAEHPLLELLVEYKKYIKLGQMSEIFETINKVTKRIHQTLNQVVDTGRFSSSNPNVMQIPARSDEGAAFRRLFEAEVGAMMAVADYSAIELFILGIRSKDKNINQALDQDLDAHCWTMSKFVNTDYEALFRLKEHDPEKKKLLATESDSELVAKSRKVFETKFNLPELNRCGWDFNGIRKWVKTFRDYVKTLTYGIAYGLSAFGLSRRFHCDVEEAERFIYVFFQIYPEIKEWLDRQSDFAERWGYSRTASGRRRYYKTPFKPSDKDIDEEMLRILKQQERDIRSMPPKERSEFRQDIKKRLWREYNQTLSRIRRQAANHPIQGGSADITKWAMVLFERWWVPYAREHRLNYLKYGIILTVHDELVIETPVKHIKLAMEKLKWAMETAAKDFLGYQANIVVKPVETPFWKK